MDKLRILDEFAEKIREIWQDAMEVQARAEDEVLERAKQKYIEAGEPEDMHYMDYYEPPEDVWQEEIEKGLKKIAEIEEGEVDYESTVIVNYKGVRIGIVFDSPTSDDDGHTFVGYTLGLVVPKISMPENTDVIAIDFEKNIALCFTEEETHIGDSVGYSIPEVNVDLALRIVQESEDYIIAMPLKSFEVHGEEAVRMEGMMGLYLIYSEYKLIGSISIDHKVLSLLS